MPARVDQEPEDCPCLFDAIRSLLAAPPGLLAHAGVVLFAAPGGSLDCDLSSQAVEELIAETDANDVSIHSVTLPGLSEHAVSVLQILCDKTGGILVPTPAAGLLYESFIEPLEVAFQCHTEPADSVVLTIESGDATGRVELAVSGGRTD
jgi:hypothetical protein